MNAEISICVPAYRAEKFLSEALESVRAQTFDDWELIVIEDGSRDRTEDIVREFAASVRQRVGFTRHAQNRGLATTRNTGFAEARGEWLALLDADDIWRSDHLAALVDAQRQSSAELVFSGCRLFCGVSGETLGTREATSDICAAMGEALYQGRVVIQPSTVMFRRKVIERIGLFDATFPICNDFEYWMRAAVAGVSFGYTGKITCDYRKHSQAMSNKSAELIAEAAAICRRYRTLSAITASDRRLVPAKHFFNAAKIEARRRPLLAARLAMTSALCRAGL